ncbi:hypothetical protein [Puia sp.]|uniref:hypothetical protein n=1 Tax=Puia sp. TaxID=2045100 RepID=UPI002F40EB1F
MKKLLLLLLLLPALISGQVLETSLSNIYKLGFSEAIGIPSADQGAAKYQVYPGEYNTYVRNPGTKLLYDITSAGLNPANISPLPGSPVIADEDQPGQSWKGSAALHHAGFIDNTGNVWAIGQVTISGKSAANGLVKTPVTNAVQVVAYANGGDANGNGIAVLTKDGKVVLIGNTQSGMRGDGTEGNAAEPAPYTVNLPVAIKKIQAGSYFFALGVDGKVYRWGGTRPDAYWSQFSCGAFSSKPNLTIPAAMVLPEPIVDIQGGADWSYAVGASGKIYVWGYDGRYWGNSAQSQKLQCFDITASLKLPGTNGQLSIGTQASYYLMPNGDAYAWGDNTEAQIGNGAEAKFANGLAPWNGGLLWVFPPVKINPAGVSFVKLFTSIGDAFYVYAEDANGNLWVWGRNKGFVLWNGQGSTNSDTQAAQPNFWDVLAPMKIAGFGTIATTTPPPVVIPACPTCPTCPPPVVCPVPRTVLSVTITLFGVDITIPAAQVKQITYDNGTTQLP